ncbi:hypothetical protein UlMin_041637 [Ulmus minor]
MSASISAKRFATACSMDSLIEERLDPDPRDYGTKEDVTVTVSLRHSGGCRQDELGTTAVLEPKSQVRALGLEEEMTLTYNMLVGASKGFEKRLQLVGVGYRATLEGQILVLSLGFSHPVEDNTRIVVSGSDKSGIGQFAASIGKWRPPKPHKGKVVKYLDENIRRKEGNTGKKK